MPNFRLDENRSKALGAAGLPNASRIDESIEGAEGPTVVYQGTIAVDDVTSLAPVHYVPEYGVQWDVPAAAGFASAIEIVAGVNPFRLERVDPVVGNVEISVILDGVSRILASSGVVSELEPLSQFAPRTTTFRTGTANDAGGFLIENNRIAELGLIFPPGSIAYLQGAGVNLQNFCWAVITEFPGGVSRTVT